MGRAAGSETRRPITTFIKKDSQNDSPLMGWPLPPV
jgi:hypothetical protein